MMKNTDKIIAVIVVAMLAVFGWLILGDREMMIPGSPTVCECSSCDSCETQLSNASCSEVRLTADITNESGTCINNPANFNNKTFDCQGHTIDGIDSGSEDYGISISGKSGNVIRNCTVTDFYYGIRLVSSYNNTISNNILDSNNYSGIYLYLSSYNNTIINNSADGNKYYGIYLFNSCNENYIINNSVSSGVVGIKVYWGSNDNSIINNTVTSVGEDGIHIHENSHNNTIFSNTANGNKFGIYFESDCFDNIANENSLCDNTIKDLQDDDSNSGDNNTCETTQNWNDTGTTGCTWFCPNRHYFNWTVRHQSRYYEFPAEKDLTLRCSALEWQCEPAYQRAYWSRPAWRIYNNKTGCTIGSLYFKVNESCEGVTLKFGKEKYYWLASSLTTSETEIAISGIATGSYQDIYLWADFQNPPQTCDPGYELRVEGSCS